MNVVYNGITHAISQNAVNYISFLSTLQNTKVGVDMTSDGSYIVPYELEGYITFLETGIVGDNYNEEIWDFMGHSNTFGFDRDYYIVRLEDRWIRDHMYKLDLISVDLYGLEKMEMCSESTGLCEVLHHIADKFRNCNPIIAGGSALFASENGSCTYGDIDVFFVGDDCDRAEKVIKDNRDSYYIGDKCASHARHNYQVIFRRYSSVSEIVHGFDLDCCGFCIVGSRLEYIEEDSSEDEDNWRFVMGDLYCTKRAKFSAINKVNWFDPDRMSSSYVFRLAKYASRGYAIKCPGVTVKNVNIRSIERDILTYGNSSKYIGYMNAEPTIPSPETYFDYYATLLVNNEKLGGFDFSHLLMLDAIRNKHSHVNVIFADLFKRFKVDYATLLFMAAYMGIYPPSCNSTYDTEDNGKIPLDSKNVIHGGMQDRDRSDEWTKITWIEQDPTTQVTTTFNPQPIDNIADYYSMSKYYIP